MHLADCNKAREHRSRGATNFYLETRLNVWRRTHAEPLYYPLHGHRTRHSVDEFKKLVFTTDEDGEDAFDFRRVVPIRTASPRTKAVLPS